MRTSFRIAITTGDVDGIGGEITAKALLKLKPKPGVFFYLWRSPKFSKHNLARIDRSFKRITVSSWPEALKLKLGSHRQIVDICSHLSPPLWVEMSTRAALYGHIDAIVTAPMSKSLIHAAGLKDMGHTDIFRRICKQDDLFMGFIGKKFSVVLATDHMPLKKVSASLTIERVLNACLAADQLRKCLPKALNKRPLGLLGFNPHSSEGGLIGTEEESVHADVLASLKRKHVSCIGPLVPDVAFLVERQKEVSVYIANYHDQGLIPFKTVHGQEDGVHITLGLPFIRTSVDHGTAKDIFGKDKANPQSMLLAFQWAIELARTRPENRNIKSESLSSVEVPQ